MSDQSHSESERHRGQFISRYQLLEEIGSGGAGVVYRAYDPDLKKTVAVKALVKDQITDAKVMRFQKEAKALRKLNHASIPEVYNFAVSDGGQPYLVMEFVEGTSLRTLLEAGPIDRFDQCAVIEMVCDALAYAHGHGVIHRDIKPENIRINLEGEDYVEVKVIDFGVAQLEDPSGEQDMTKSGQIVGSPAYMSPEQIRGHDVDGRSDIYSLGCVIFEMLAGLPPFSGDTALAIAMKQVNEEPPRLSEINPGQSFPLELENAVRQCLAKNPGERLQSMGEVKDAFVNLLLPDAPPPTVSHMVQEVGGVYGASEVNDEEGGKEQPVKRRLNFIAVGLLAAAVIGGISVVLVNRVFSDSLSLSGTSTSTGISDDSISKELDKMEAQRWRILDISGLPFYTATPEARDEHFEMLADLPDVENIRIMLSNLITGDGLKYLKNGKLKRFICTSSKFNDDGMRNLSAIKSLESLNIELTTNLTNNGIRELINMPNLETLNFTHVTLPSETFSTVSKLKLQNLGFRKCRGLEPKSIELLAAMPNLGSLTLRDCGLTDEDCRLFAGLKHLKELDIQKNQITDEGLRTIAALDLGSLTIKQNPVTDRGIEHLNGMKDLLLLDIVGLNISQKARAEFRKKHPNCKLKTEAIQNEDEFSSRNP